MFTRNKNDVVSVVIEFEFLVNHDCYVTLKIPLNTLYNTYIIKCL